MLAPSQRAKALEEASKQETIQEEKGSSGGADKPSIPPKPGDSKGLAAMKKAAGTDSGGPGGGAATAVSAFEGAGAAAAAKKAPPLPKETLELQGAEFETKFGVSRSEYDAMVPFKQAKVRDQVRAGLLKKELAMEAEAAKAAEAEKEKEKEAGKAAEVQAEKIIDALQKELASKGPQALKSINPKFLLPSAAQTGELKTEMAGGAFGMNEFYILWPGKALPRVPKGERYLCTYANKNSKAAKKVLQIPAGTCRVGKPKSTGECVVLLSR